MSMARLWTVAALTLVACGGSPDGPADVGDAGHCGSVPVCTASHDYATAIYAQGAASSTICGYPIADAGDNCALAAGQIVCQTRTPGARCVPGYRCIVAYPDGTSMSGVCQ